MAEPAPRPEGAEQAVSFTLPADLLAAVGWTREELARRARQWCVIGLFCEAEISGSKAAELLGLSGLVEFRELIARYHIPHTVVTLEDLEHDFELLRARRRETL